MADQTPPDDYVDRDFVYCGLRFFEKEFLVIVAPINPDGTLQKECSYNYKKGRDRTIGGIYRGASFNEKGCRNLDNATYVDKYHDTDLIIGWKAKNDQAKSKERIYKIEKDVKKTNEIDEQILALRKLYTSYRKRNDFAGMDALEAAVLRSLRTPIRQSESDN